MSVSIPTWLLYLFVGVLGLTVGSFATVLIARVPTSESLTTRSRCVHCAKQLTWWENIPLFSYIALRGKCSACGARISFRYPGIEVSMLILFILPLVLLNSWTAVILWQVMAALGLPLSIIDAEQHRLPDLLTGCLFGVSLLIIIGDAIHWNHFDRIAPSLMGAVGLMLFYLLLLIISRGHGNGGCKTFREHWINLRLFRDSCITHRFFFRFFPWSAHWNWADAYWKSGQENRYPLWTLHDRRSAHFTCYLCALTIEVRCHFLRKFEPLRYVILIVS